jgi:hypothetical protein
MKKVYLKEDLSVDLAALINLVLFAKKFLNSRHGIINFSAYLCSDHFYTKAISFVTPKVIHNTEYSLHKIIPDLYISVYVSYYE